MQHSKVATNLQRPRPDRELPNTQTNPTPSPLESTPKLVTTAAIWLLAPDPKMSRSTPRKSRHRNQPSSSGPRQIPASDHESDAAHYMEARDAPRPAHRTNTDLNMSVLRRYLPGIRSILSIAANAVVYTFSETTQEWDKSGMDGTMFVCDQEPIVTATGQTLPRVCVFVLNRNRLDNLVVDLLRVNICERQAELIIFRMEDDGQSGGEGPAGGEVIGIWIHADEHDTRETNSAIIRSSWQEARVALNAVVEAAASAAAAAAAEAAEAELAAEQTDADDGGALADAHSEVPETSGPSGGRRISITDLFGQRNGAG